MPSVQTSYTPVLAPAFAGMIADMRNRTVISKTSQSATAIPFGAPVFRGTIDEGVLQLTDASVGAFVGIAVTDPTVKPSNALNTYAPTDTVAVIRGGIVWVTVASNVTPGAPAYYTPGGAITATSSSNTAIANATFESTASSGGLAKLRLG